VGGHVAAAKELTCPGPTTTTRTFTAPRSTSLKLNTLVQAQASSCDNVAYTSAFASYLCEKRERTAIDMAHSKREIKPGRAHTKVAGDDEMLRTGFFDGTPLEGGKIADSQPVDLFAAARRVADAPYSSQQEGPHEEGTNKNAVIAESEPVDLPASARGVAEVNPAGPEEQTGRGRQGMAEPTAGGRRLGLGRPAPA
jgi:hypothetical protein